MLNKTSKITENKYFKASGSLQTESPSNGIKTIKPRITGSFFLGFDYYFNKNDDHEEKELFVRVMDSWSDRTWGNLCTKVGSDPKKFVKSIQF